jgi:asparaginyl-tRNA synthetase
MERSTPIKEILEGKWTAKQVWIRGWIYRARSSGKIVFDQIRDKSGIIQVIASEEELAEKEFEGAKHALIESSVEIKGMVKRDSRAPGGYEVKAKEFKVIHFSESFPISKDKSIEFLLDQRHLWVRSRRLAAIMRIKAQSLRIFREWFDSNDFIEVTPPIITTSTAEGGATAFELDYFGQLAYLAQTAQMYLEALIFSGERVWSLTPSFRAEKSRTRKHLIEYMHLEAEMAWTDHEENMRIQEELVAYATNEIASRCKKEFEEIKVDPSSLLAISPPFRRIEYKDAIEILRSKGIDLKWGEDLGAPHEKALLEESCEPIFITNFPKECKAFYMKENPKDPRTYFCNDLLVPNGGEIIGASERETDVNELIKRLKALGIKDPDSPKSGYKWYLDLRRYGSVPHSGFGLGVERFLLWVTGQEHIRDMQPFPRTPSRVYP